VRSLLLARPRGRARLCLLAMSPPSLPPITTATCSGARDVTAAEWNALVDDDDPFLEHAFLLALERSGSVGPGTGWQPHFVLARRGEALVGAVPLYLKDDCMGEFIWDFAWAHGARSAGIRYFPKLVAAVPFTPAPNHRLLVHPHEERATVIPALIRAMRAAADETHASSVHVLYCEEDEVAPLVAEGFMARASYQHQWHNRSPEPYRDFDDFLSSLRSRSRKQTRHERSAVDATGLRIVTAIGSELDERDWLALDTFYRTTVYRYGNIDALTPEFFAELRRTHARRLLAAIAYDGREPVAATTNFVRKDRLAGRYWGCARPIPFLHFELCFYRLIDYAIAHGIARFEGGAGGDQKLKRGLLPRRTFSAHWIRHPGLARAVADYVVREAAVVEEEIHAELAHSPFVDGRQAR
jgi:predicted N-acyltransferase